MKKEKMRSGLISLLFICSIMLLVSCGGGGGSDDGPPPVGTVTVSSGASEMIADGITTVWIAATVRDPDGVLVDDETDVTFSTSAGTLSATSAETLDGVARVNLTSATNVGEARVTVTSEGATGTISITFIPGAPARVVVTATPATLTTDGASTSAIEATVYDANNNIVADGEVLTFSAQSGALSDFTAETSGGVASVTYTAPAFLPTSRNDTITIQTTGLATGFITISLRGPEIASITLSANPASLPANGTSQATISAAVTVAGGGDAPDGTLVDFSITTTGGGSCGGGSSTAQAQVAGGVAVVILTSAPATGTDTIRAESGGIREEISVAYQPGSITLTIIPNSLPATGVAEAQVTAELRNTAGTPAPDGATVRFELSDNSMGTIPASALVTGGLGEALVVFRGGIKGGTVTVTASWTATGGEVVGSADVTIQPPPADISVADGYPTPTSINVRGTGGQSTAQIVFDIKDPTGSLVADGYKILFTILQGPGGQEEVSPTWDTTENGQVSATLRSGFRSGPVSVKATYFNDTTVNTTTSEIAIMAGPPVGEGFGIGAQYLNISGLWRFGLEDVITINADDIWGNAVPDDTSISFKTYNTGGLFDPGSSPTSAGFANSTLFSTDNPTPQQGFVSTTGEAINGGATTHVTCLAVTPSPDNHIIYAGTDGGGVYKSTNSGATWANVSRSTSTQGQNWIYPYVNDIHVDPGDHDIIYAATGYQGQGNVYRSVDGGLNWNSNNVEEWNGLFSINAAVLTILCDASSNYVWIGTEGLGLFLATDGETFVAPAGIPAALGHGKIIRDIVKVSGGFANTTILYAATAEGVFRSGNGGASWIGCGTFTGDSINTLALYPATPDTPGGLLPGLASVIYAGTEDAGVWVTTNNGTNWTRYDGGMGKGLSASTPVAAVANTGNGVMGEPSVGSGTLSEYWTVVCTAAAANGGTFSVTGSVSGARADYDITTGTYVISNVLSFAISDGSIDFVTGDTITFSTLRDSGATIKDLLVDDRNNLLYAITYFLGLGEPHAVSNVYVHELNADGSMATGDWVEANNGLPQYSPPDDTTLFAQHTMAPDFQGTPSALYIGGEGINLYKASIGLGTTAPAWQASKSGLSNMIMARMPILFSGECAMSIDDNSTAIPGGNVLTGTDGDTSAGSPTFTSLTDAQFQTSGARAGDFLTINTGADMGIYLIINVLDETRVTLNQNMTANAGDDISFSVDTPAAQVTYIVYVQDVNGNPPIAGSKFKAEYKPPSGDTVVFYDITYPDTYTYTGTFRDPSDAGTDNPYVVYLPGASAGGEMTFTYTPACDDAAPGCSGSDLELKYGFQ
ncbi:MAG: hypothetical protein GY864_02805 [Desulfobacterales bacterium]|nr:hypothetical protein [Desulfobacterales bacterium]